MGIGLGDNEAVLAQALQEVQSKWETTGSVWRDKAREDFEKRYLGDMVMSGRAALRSMRAVRELLMDAVRECSESR
jgi:hypothetical protein